MRVCSKCGKKTRIGRNRSHAQNRSSRTFKANIQKVAGVWLCAKCIKKNKSLVRKLADLESKKAGSKKKEDKRKK